MVLLLASPLAIAASLAESQAFPPGNTQANEGQLYEEWNRTFGGPYGDGVWSVQETEDGGCILAGYTSSRGEGSDLWLIKTDSQGRDQWNRVFGGSGEDVGYIVLNTKDGGFIVVGSTASYGMGDERLWLLKADSNGSKQWDRTFGGFVSSAGDGGWSVNETDDGGYILTGYTRSNGAGGKDLWLIKADSAGNKLWDKTFGGPKDDVGMSVIQLGDGGYLVAGRTASYGSGKDDIWLLKTDSEGRERWNRTFGGAKDDVGFQVLQISDGYVLVGRTESGREGKRAILIGTDLRGSKIWEKSYRDGSAGISVQKSFDGGFVISGNIDLPNADRDALIIKTDLLGREEWAQALGGPGGEIGSFALQCRDGSYILAGITDSFGAGAEDAWLVKLKMQPGMNRSIESRSNESAAREEKGDTAATKGGVNPDINATGLENLTSEKSIRQEGGATPNQNIFKQKMRSIPDVFSGQDFGFEPLRPLPTADLLRRAGQSA